MKFEYFEETYNINTKEMTSSAKVYFSGTVKELEEELSKL